MSVIFRTEIVDGESFEVVDDESLPEVASLSAPGVVHDWLLWAVRFVSGHHEFSLSRREFGLRNKVQWMILLSAAHGRQRVEVEQVACESCSMSVCLANPTLPDLYVGLSNLYDLLDRTWEMPTVPCPVCRSVLPRRAVWATIHVR